MLDDEVLIGHEYIHTKSQNTYKVLDKCKSKNPTTGEWYDAIIYQPCYDNKGIYVRAEYDFKRNFEHTDNIIET